MHDVLVSLIPGFQPLDVVGPHEVLALATALTDEKGQVPLEDYPASSTGSALPWH